MLEYIRDDGKMYLLFDKAFANAKYNFWKASLKTREMTIANIHGIGKVSYSVRACKNNYYRIYY